MQESRRWCASRGIRTTTKTATKTADTETCLIKTLQQNGRECARGVRAK